MFVCTKCKREVSEGLFCPFCGAAAPQAGSEPGDPYVGRTVAEKYFIHQLLGRGGMGQVYKATHLTLDRPVVLKLLNRSLLNDPSIVQRFHREARAASRLNHPNSINVIDFGQTEDGTLFMAMEFLPGRSLAKVIAEDFPVAPARVVKIVSQVLAALTEAHAQGILHRDLKPENVMVESRRDEADFVKVLDFGIAKLNEPGSESGARLTQAGMVCGTPGYMSPEQARGEDLDARSDLYAVGVILYELMTGQMPFDADTPMALVTKVLVEEPIPPSVRRPDLSIPPDIEALVMRALAIDRNARPASADDMRRELTACAIPEAPASRPTPAPSHATVVLGAVPEPAARKPTSSGPGAPAAGARPVTGGGRPATQRPSGSVKAPTAAPRAPTGAPASARPSTPLGAPRGGPTLSLDTSPGARPATAPRAPVRPATPAPSQGEGFEAGAEEGGEEEVEVRPTPARVRRPPTSPRGRVEEAAGLRKSKMPLIAGGAAAGVVLVALVIYGATRGGDKTVSPPPSPPVAVTPERPAPVQPTPAPAQPPPSPVPAPPQAGTGPSAEQPGAAPPVAPPPKETIATELTVPAPPPVEVARTVPRPEPRPRPETHRPASRPATDPIRVVKGELNTLPVPPASSGEGILAIVATPWAEVSVNGRLLGETPRELRVVAGTYQVRAKHPTLGTTEGTVRVAAGKRQLYNAPLVGK